jgi:TIR domain
MTATQHVDGTETRIKVFISYSRADKAFASELVLGLAACGFAPYIDRQDIAPGEDWERRLAGLT